MKERPGGMVMATLSKQGPGDCVAAKVLVGSGGHSRLTWPMSTEKAKGVMCGLLRRRFGIAAGKVFVGGRFYQVRKCILVDQSRQTESLLAPLTSQQQQMVLDWLPAVKQWVIDRCPALSERRETLEANAMLTLCQAVQAWPGVGDFVSWYLIRCLTNGKTDAFKEEQKHQILPKRNCQARDASWLPGESREGAEGSPAAGVARGRKPQDHTRPRCPR